MNFEKLFNIAIYKLIENNGGSLEETLDEMRILDEKRRKEIKEYLDWEEEN